MAAAALLGDPLAPPLTLSPGVAVRVAVVEGLAVTVTVDGLPEAEVEDEEDESLGELVLDPSDEPEELLEPLDEPDDDGDVELPEAEVDAVLDATVSLSELLAVPLEGAPQAPRAATGTRQRGRRAKRRAVLVMSGR